MDKYLKKLRKAYEEIPIPKELDNVVQSSLQKQKKPKSPFRSKWLIGLAAAVLLFVFSINTSQTFAESLAKVPVIGSVVDVLTIKEIHVEKDNYNADIETPAIHGMGDKELEDSLNQKYIEESQQLYETFKEEMDYLEEADGGHLAIDSGYEVKTNNDRILSIERSVTETEASSYTTHQYDTIDKKKKIMLTLPILFKDDQYIENISDEIKRQMREQMEEDENVMYWLDGPRTEEMDSADLFDRIDANQKFYINKNRKLVIAFDDYEVAPGYMGAVEFVIPTDKIDGNLVGNEYIQ